MAGVWAKVDLVAFHTSTLAVLWMALGLSLLLPLQGCFLARVTGCVGTWKELAVETGKAARGLQYGLCRSRYFLRSTSVFPQKVSGLPSIKYHLLTKSCSPLASEHLTLFFRLNVEEKWCLSPVPPINPFMSELALGWGGQHAACLLTTVPTASMNLAGDMGSCRCPEVSYECLQWQHWLVADPSPWK